MKENFVLIIPMLLLLHGTCFVRRVVHIHELNEFIDIRLFFTGKQIQRMKPKSTAQPVDKVPKREQ